MENPIEIGRRSPQSVAKEYAKTWNQQLAANQRGVLASEIAELIEMFLKREREGN
jgi:hypothetical protein